LTLPPRNEKGPRRFLRREPFGEALSELPRKRKRFIETFEKVAIIIIEIVNKALQHG